MNAKKALLYTLFGTLPIHIPWRDYSTIPAPTQKIFLLDAMAFIYQSYFISSKHPRINSQGINTGAALGFTNILVEVLRKEKPTHIAVAFDKAAPTWRHQLYQAYKANREEKPADAIASIPYVKQILRAFRIPVIESEGYEADDIIGTLAYQAAQRGFSVYMMTHDKDLLQLVDKDIYLYKPAYRGNSAAVLDTQAVLEKWEIARVDQVRDILALQGDFADNIPGIPTIGIKTAQSLIRQFGSVENLIAQADQLPGKLRENVIANSQKAILFKKLTTIHTNVPLQFDLAQSRYRGPNRKHLRAIFKHLELRELSRRVLREPRNTNGGSPRQKNKFFNSKNQFASTKPPVAPDTPKTLANIYTTPRQSLSRSSWGGLLNTNAGSPGREDKFFNSKNQLASTKPPVTPDMPKTLANIYTTPHQYHLIDTPAQRQKLISCLALQDTICLDTETTGLDPQQATIIGIAWAYHPGEAYYVPLPKNYAQAKAIVGEFKSILGSPSIRKVGHNLKYDNRMLQRYGVEIAPPIFDTMVAHYLLAPNSFHNMNAMAKQYLAYAPLAIETLIGPKGASQKNMQDIDLGLVKEYACEDVDITLQLQQRLQQAIKQKNLHKLFYEVELPLVHVLAAMEKNGVRVDTGLLQETATTLAQELQTLEQNIYGLASCTFNIDSSKQLGDLLFDQLKLTDKPKKTPTGQYATGASVLAEFAKDHELVAKILEYRELKKLKSTYADALPRLCSSIDGRIHTSYKQVIVVQGRLTSARPNLQTIPVRTAKGRAIRKAFLPSSADHVLLTADYPQLDLRVMASLAQEKKMIEVFKAGRDIHTAIASRLFKVLPAAVSDNMRHQAKMVSFCIIYGISAVQLSHWISTTRTEAISILQAYFKEFPAIKTYRDGIITQARRQGYVTTLMGRKRFLTNPKSHDATGQNFNAYNVINTPIQGTATEMTKLAMIRVHNWLRDAQLQAKMVMQVHDELVFDVPKAEVAQLQEHLPLLMKNALPPTIPVEVEIGIGSNWLEVQKYIDS